MASSPRSHLIVCFFFQTFQVITSPLKLRVFILLIFFASSIIIIIIIIINFRYFLKRSIMSTTFSKKILDGKLLLVVTLIHNQNYFDVHNNNPLPRICCGSIMNIKFLFFKCSLRDLKPIWHELISFSLFEFLAYFWYYLWAPLHFLILFFIVLFN